MVSPGHVQLPDGRQLDVRVSGPDGAVPFVFHHGTPGAAIPVRALERAVHARGLRLVTMSRAGYGSSTRLPGRCVADVVADTAAVLDAIGARRCLVGGWSGGGPHALACAARLGQTAAALVIAGVAPYEAPGLDWLADMGEDNLIEFGAATNGEERLLDYLLEVLEHLKEVTAASIIASFASLLPDTDKAVLTDEFGEDIAAAFQEGLGPGVDGWLDDDLAFINPWGFDVGEIAVPTSVWHGSADLFVPFTHGQWIAKHVAGATAHLEPGEGHLSLLLGALDRMLDELVSADVGD